VNISPGIVGMYWLLASFGLGTLWCAACKIARWLHRSIDQAATLPARARCCGMCDQ
jgi:type IV secretory pathway TrbD component